MALCESTCLKSEGKENYSSYKPKANVSTKDVTITVTSSETGDVKNVSNIDEASGLLKMF